MKYLTEVHIMKFIFITCILLPLIFSCHSDNPTFQKEKNLLDKHGVPVFSPNIIVDDSYFEVFCDIASSGSQANPRLCGLIDFYITNSLNTKALQFNTRQKILDLHLWLGGFDCVDTVIISNSTVLTIPPIKELGIRFIIKGDTVMKTLDLILGNNLRVERVHD